MSGRMYSALMSLAVCVVSLAAFGPAATVGSPASGKVFAQHQRTRSSVPPLSRGVTKNWAYGGMIRAGDHLIHDNGLVKMFPINDALAPARYAAIPDDVYAQPMCDGPALYVRSLNALWRFDNPDGAGRTRADVPNGQSNRMAMAATGDRL